MKIRINIAPMQKALRGIERQAKFGAAQALNEWVEVYKLRAIDHLPRYFKVRSGWNAKGFRTGHATRDKLTAWVGHLDNMNTKNGDNFMKRQAEGGMKPVKSGQRFGEQGIPQEGNVPGSIKMPRGTGGERPTYRGSNWIKQLIAAVRKFETKQTKARGKKTKRASERAFASAASTRAAENKLVFLEHASIQTLAIRVGKGNKRGVYVPLWFLYKAPVKIPKRWMFYEEGESFAKSNLPPMMDWHINKWINKIGNP